MSLSSLLVAIANDPDREAVQGILADYLEEWNDPRSAIVRAVDYDPELWHSFAPHVTGVELTIENIHIAVQQGLAACDLEMRRRILALFPETVEKRE